MIASPVAVSTRPLTPPAVVSVYVSVKDCCPSSPASVVVLIKLLVKLLVASAVRSVSSTCRVDSVAAVVSTTTVGASSLKLILLPISIEAVSDLLSPSLSTIVTSLVKVIRLSVIVALTSSSLLGSECTIALC